jgi:hypothetical protein
MSGAELGAVHEGDPKARQGRVKIYLERLDKRRIGLIVGPLFFGVLP